ncbi:RecQ family ATP-dependent DNA helicase [Aquibacillus halophilus]|uniref:ATP-dependent DNA helicase RecQ n=1 Tax=Aquibacillus halophilus TaxID=930132 RepID=A0A6A8DHJ2_9BACI|nr:RecQ family ATP-dependent DNA helicase [Aquibacillus halophilus]MRH42367.1 RecQ family ATP-dependent DNA helicase [Aquibacillus halophilus]
MVSNLEAELNRHYHFSTFRTGQKEIITDILNGCNVMGVLPTGTGKSLCYQLPARLLDGTVIVVSPLISLMIDQVKELKASGFKEVIAINSFLKISDRTSVLKKLDEYKLIYVSPEMLQNPLFVQKLKKIDVSLFVVDEAHCISQWGHEFRPDYLKLNNIINQLGFPTVLALTGTATPEVQSDIKKQLGCKEMRKHIYPMDRENIAFMVERFNHYQEKMDYLTQLLKKYIVPTMIYFSSRNTTEKASKQLSINLPNHRIAYYHGGMEQEDRILIQQQFMNNQLDIICCTSAFGMGINKKDIRLVLHFHLPTQIESFIQEIGRAGRDGQSSLSLVLIGPNDHLLPKKLIENELPNVQDVSNLVDHLFSRNLENKRLILKETDLTNLFNLNETQWRFLVFQFEKHGMIKENRILKEFADWENIKTIINNMILSRNKYKQEKLSELLQWASNDDMCRRKTLFSSFQNTISDPLYGCCDVCGFFISNWEPLTSEENTRLPAKNWEETWKQLMLQGDYH